MMVIDNVSGKAGMSGCLIMSLRAAPDKANAGSQQIQHALPPWPIQAHDRLGLALGG
jgi:hypothetical protein